MGPVAVLAVFALAAACYGALRRGDKQARRALTLWAAISAGTTLILWIPPLVDEVGGTGNLTLLWQYVTDPGNRPIGAGRGGELLLLHLNPVRLLNREIWGMYRDVGPEPAGSVVPGVAHAHGLGCSRRRQPAAARQATLCPQPSPGRALASAASSVRLDTSSLA
jgi:hypothetical protein